MTNQTTGTRTIPAIPPTVPIPTDVEGDPTHLAAAEWFLRLHGAEASVEDTLAWQRWLHESASHAEAFARIEEVSQVLRSVPPPAAVTASRLASDRYDASIPLKDWKEREAARKDCHLLYAALESDRTVASLDETIRRLFAAACPAAVEIRDVVWVNPDRDDDEALE